jgi:hypothetical protein
MTSLRVSCKHFAEKCAPRSRVGASPRHDWLLETRIPRKRHYQGLMDGIATPSGIVLMQKLVAEARRKRKLLEDNHFRPSANTSKISTTHMSEVGFRNRM